MCNSLSEVIEESVSFDERQLSVTLLQGAFIELNQSKHLMLRLSGSDLIIGGIWATFILILNVSFGSSPASQTFPMPLSNGMAVIILIMPIAFFGIMSFIGPARSPFYLPNKLVSFINDRCGQHAWESFLVRLRPLLLFALASLLGGFIGLWRTFQEGGPYEAYIYNGLWVSSGLAFAIAHTILYLRKAEGIYPSYVSPSS